MNGLDFTVERVTDIVLRIVRLSPLTSDHFPEKMVQGLVKNFLLLKWNLVDKNTSRISKMYLMLSRIVMDIKDVNLIFVNK